MVPRRNRICIALTVLFALVGVSGAGEMPETLPVEPQSGETPVPASPAPADGGIAAGGDNSVLQPTATDNAPAFPGPPPPTGAGDTEGTVPPRRSRIRSSRSTGGSST